MSHDIDSSDVLGYGNYKYKPQPDWPMIPDDSGFVEAIGVAAGPGDRVYVFNRGNPAVFVFESDGQFVETWGDDCFVRPHGIMVASDQTLYLTDDMGHRVAQFTTDGKLIRDLGPAGIPSNTGVVGFDYRTITADGPYNLPTNVAVTDDGHVFVSDGYGNACIHHFDTDGTFIGSWGTLGDAEGQFKVPHGICVDSVGRILVADRENSRIQIFDRDGTLQEQWTDVVRPCQVIEHDDVIYVAELGNQNGRFPFHPEPDQLTGGRVSIFDRDGVLLSRWGGGLDPHQPDSFFACHDISVDSQGSIYVGEVAATVAAVSNQDATGLRSLKKFTRI
ncbi:MAG: peptidyl-alpha-hydroxyglycine alpha-amidating lyase family protein [Fuerstiella sp.]|nr:peptidyl-alpha-hydroxyglycine alpha-amidating lyase family protein [Fuerstiella sp.]